MEDSGWTALPYCTLSSVLRGQWGSWAESSNLLPALRAGEGITGLEFWSKVTTLNISLAFSPPFFLSLQINH